MPFRIFRNLQTFENLVRHLNILLWFFIGYWILIRAGFLSGLLFFIMRFNQKKTFTVLVVIGSCVGIGISSFRIPPENKPGYKNLKVLSRDISEEEMDRVMHSFNSELGVTCIYCHVTDRSQTIPRADFVSDEKPEKNIARQMLQMTIKLNRRYFGSSVDGKLQTPVKVWCTTCHRGLLKPAWKNK
jgi:hypothetical protein